MGTLYLDRKELSLKLDSHSLALYEQGEKKGTIPFRMLERIVVRGNVQLETRLLCALGEQKIDVLLLSGRNNQRRSMSFCHSHNDVKRRLAQYQGYFMPVEQLQLARQLVLHKLKNQQRFLSTAMQQRADLRQPLFSARESLASIISKLDAALSEEYNIASLRGYEGAAAAAYFSAFTRLFPPSLNFTNRNKRPPRDPVNACLSLGYTLLHFEAVTVCRMVGLDPLLGFYHEPDYGRDSLACDLIEPLRSRLDAWVWMLFRDRLLRNEYFANDDGRCLLNKSGRKCFYAQYEVFIQPLRRLLRLYAHQLAKFYLQAEWELPL
jgi:CRISP-associated protein Cas1